MVHRKKRPKNVCDIATERDVEGVLFNRLRTTVLVVVLLLALPFLYQPLQGNINIDLILGGNGVTRDFPVRDRL